MIWVTSAAASLSLVVTNLYVQIVKKRFMSLYCVTTQDSGESFCLVFQLVVKSSLVVLNKFIVLYTSQKLNAYR